MLAYIGKDMLLNTNEIHSISVKELHDGTWEIDLKMVDGMRYPSLSIYKTKEEAEEGLKRVYHNLQKANCAVKIA